MVLLLVLLMLANLFLPYIVFVEEVHLECVFVPPGHYLLTGFIFNKYVNADTQFTFSGMIDEGSDKVGKAATWIYPDLH